MDNKIETAELRQDNPQTEKITDSRRRLFDSLSDRIPDILFCLLFIAAVAFLIWKAEYGYGNRDESFYLTVPKRLAQGDSLITDEWHVSQLSGLLIYPIVKIYMLINPTFEGAILHFRYIYIAFQSVAALCLYLMLRRTSKFGALIGSLFFMLYAPFNISALSYNSMGVGFFALSTAAFITRKPYDKSVGKKRKILGFLRDMLTGILFSAAVLCSPYLAALYFIYLICASAAAVISKITKKRYDGGSLLDLKTVLGITAGVASAAGLFFVFLLSRASVSDIIKSVPMIFSDPEHRAISLFNTIKYFCYYVKGSNAAAPYCFAAAALLMTVSAIDRKSPLRKTVYFALAAVTTLIYTLNFGSMPTINCFMMPLNILGAVSYFLLADRPKKLFYGMWLPTLFYAYAISASSNQCFLVVSSAYSVGTIASAVFIALFIAEQAEGNFAALFVTFLSATAAFSILFVMFMNVRINSNFWDSENDELDTKIEYGINRGVKTQAAFSLYYDRLMEDTEEIRSIESGNVLYFSTETCLYVADGKRNASFSGWISIGSKEKNEISEAISRLADYYKLNPEKRPDFIYLNIDTEGTLENLIDKLNLDCDVEMTKYGSYILTCRWE